jgi:hypothetical protein
MAFVAGALLDGCSRQRFVFKSLPRVGNKKRAGVKGAF